MERSEAIAYFMAPIRRYLAEQAVTDGIAGLLARSPFDLTEAEAALYRKQLLPLKAELKRILAESLSRLGPDKSDWLEGMAACQGTTLASLALEVMNSSED